MPSNKRALLGPYAAWGGAIGNEEAEKPKPKINTPGEAGKPKNPGLLIVEGLLYEGSCS